MKCGGCEFESNMYLLCDLGQLIQPLRLHFFIYKIEILTLVKPHSAVFDLQKFHMVKPYSIILIGFV